MTEAAHDRLTFKYVQPGDELELTEFIDSLDGVRGLVREILEELGLDQETIHLAINAPHAGCIKWDLILSQRAGVAATQATLVVTLLMLLLQLQSDEPAAQPVVNYNGPVTVVIDGERMSDVDPAILERMSKRATVQDCVAKVVAPVALRDHTELLAVSLNGASPLSIGKDRARIVLDRGRIPALQRDDVFVTRLTSASGTQLEVGLLAAREFMGDVLRGPKNMEIYRMAQDGTRELLVDVTFSESVESRNFRFGPIPEVRSYWANRDADDYDIRVRPIFVVTRTRSTHAYSVTFEGEESHQHLDRMLGAETRGFATYDELSALWPGCPLHELNMQGTH